MDGAILPYSGEKPYLFISYAHADRARVLPVLASLAGKRYRLWYDEGIEVGADWPEVIAGRLANASLVLLFLSERTLRSQNCVREINYAIDRRRDMACVRLDGAVPVGGMGSSPSCRRWSCSRMRRRSWTRWSKRAR